MEEGINYEVIVPKVKKAVCAFCVPPNLYETAIDKFKKANPTAEIYKQVDSVQMAEEATTGMVGGKLIQTGVAQTIMHACIIYFTVPDADNIQTIIT